jgi:hypothetical protein
MDILGGHLVERGANVVAHGVHAGSEAAYFTVERGDLLYL